MRKLVVKGLICAEMFREARRLADSGTFASAEDVGVAVVASMREKYGVSGGYGLDWEQLIQIITELLPLILMLIQLFF